jgi:hypothetical protein
VGRGGERVRYYYGNGGGHDVSTVFGAGLYDVVLLRSDESSYFPF